ncbi:hypothetical protein CTheo_2489 [Ceratobasidium theobromae]|uniref:Transmembrane protein n=1 Tax=Ceratobasidium theobromae TaxID=1582974 RepID=A0A5N5QQJ1_9AGAM|nr:hypothetical protein CTheo_2489 [Ceratobasidium theobromae]
MFGKLIRLGIDAVIISAFLAGVQRSTGLTPAIGRIKNKDLRNVLKSYLEFGEYTFDFAVVVFGVSGGSHICYAPYSISTFQRSEYFERKR